jgi:hypothetical protein
MNWQTATFGAAIIVAGMASSGCVTESIPEGAQSIFARATSCPWDRVSVTARPAIAPHKVLKPQGPDANLPTPDATDPDRISLRHNALTPGSPPVGVDALGTTYEVSGCGKTVVMVCANPIVDGRSGPFSASFSEGYAVPYATMQHNFSKAQVIDGDRVVSMVVCEQAARLPRL